MIGGLAELISGAVSMGLGSYLAVTTERQRYDNERQREVSEVETCPDKETEEIFEILCGYGPSRDEVQPFVEALCRNKEKWIEAC